MPVRLEPPPLSYLTKLLGQLEKSDCYRKLAFEGNASSPPLYHFVRISFLYLPPPNSASCVFPVVAFRKSLRKTREKKIGAARVGNPLFPSPIPSPFLPPSLPFYPEVLFPVPPTLVLSQVAPPRRVTRVSLSPLPHCSLAFSTSLFLYPPPAPLIRFELLRNAVLRRDAFEVERRKETRKIGEQVEIVLLLRVSFLFRLGFV